MSEQHQLRLLLKDFRAVKQADIIIDGITVVAGENGSGKSTISKFLYYLMNDVLTYQDYLKELFFNYLEFFLRKTIDILLKVAIDEKIEKNEFFYKKDIFSPLNYKENLKKVEKITNEISDFIKKHYEKIVKNEEFKRFWQIIKLQSNLQKDDIFAFLEHIQQEAQKHVLRIEKVPAKFFLEKLFSSYKTEKIDFKLLEFGVEIIDKRKDIVKDLMLFKKTIFIDTPLAIDAVSTLKYREHLLSLLTENENNTDLAFDNFDFEKIINGQVQYDQLIGKFKYKRADGSEFDIFDCATGLKSFAILNLLLRNNHLTNKTLLIIDEPEAHLHPQWIVEYARLIVLLNKELGVKFFIASHNPDMISALKYIAKKEGNISNLNFYLSTKQANEYTYTFTHLKDDIEPIFKEFNIALDRMEQYGDTSL